MKIYTGIGSRNTPGAILALISKISAKLNSTGYTLRSGGAGGADYAFEQSSTKKEIYIPWKNFNNNSSSLYDISENIIQESLKFHPIGEKINKGSTRLIMGRNYQQVLGKNGNKPSKFLICWIPYAVSDALDPLQCIGGTGQAIRIAHYYKIPIFNLNNFDDLCRIESWILNK